MNDDEGDLPDHREILVSGPVDGMRLDRYLAARFPDRSRTWIARGTRDGLVRDAGGRPLRASSRVRDGDVLRLYLDGIAPAGPPPPFPPVLHDDGVVLVLDKPAGLLAHPAGSTYTWGVISLAKARWPDRRVDLVHRLDRDTSGVQVLTFDLDANRFLKARLHDDGTVKEYVAICRGLPGFEVVSLTGPIGPADGPIRVQNAVRPDGQPARTDVTVLDVDAARGLSLVRCRIFTGRTHQIRVHLAHAGLPLLGDWLYGLPEALALRAVEQGVDDELRALLGAPRQALHAARLRVPHPTGGWLDVSAPLPDDLRALWAG